MAMRSLASMPPRNITSAYITRFFNLKSLLLCIGLVAVLCTLLFLPGNGRILEMSSPRRASNSQTVIKDPPKLSTTGDGTFDSWGAFDAARDGHNYGLSESQCAAAFPDFFYEVDRSMRHWKDKGGVKPKHIDIGFAGTGAVRARIVDKQLYIMEPRNGSVDPWNTGLVERVQGTLHQIQQAALFAENLPPIEFSMVTADQVLDTVAEGWPAPPDDYAGWVYARKIGNGTWDSTWLMPDFNFWAWGAVPGTYIDYIRNVSDPSFDAFLTEKDPRLVWRGAIWTQPEVRQSLVDVSKDKPWSDVQEIIWENGTMYGDPLTMEQHCRYAMNVHTEGRSWSGRLKYLLSCHAVTFVHDLEWAAFYYYLLRDSGPDQNVVSTRRNFSNLEEEIDRLQADPVEMQRIADNAAATFRDRYLTPAATACYWRRMFQGWARVSFQPDLSQDNGVAFEEYLQLLERE